jgi:aryl-alcohol dehydrogenase-like predicted oxidoreductase
MPFFAGVATEENWEKVGKLTDFAESRGKQILDLALGWVASQPETASVLVGATRPEQVASNAAAIDWQLSADELAEVGELLG